MSNRFSKLNASYRWVIQPVLVVMILLFGFFSAMGLSMFKEEPKATERKTYAPLVKTLTSKIEDRTLLIHGNGTLVPRVRVNIIPQVGGRVVRAHPELRAGGRFKADEVLLEIERIDYELAVTRNRAEVAAARKIFEVETAQATVSQQEWFTLHPKEKIPPIVARQPQIAEARANIKAAEAKLQQATLDLKRTRIRMPFAGRVVQSSVDIGEVMVANQPVGVVFGDEIFEIPIPLELDDLALIQTPDQINETNGSKVSIKISMAGTTYELPGTVDRIESEIDSLSRMVRAVIKLDSKDIPAPLRNKVIPGLFVDVEIKAKELSAISLVPKSALRANNTLWIAKNGRLRIIKPEVVYQSDSELYIKGLDSGTLVITSQLDVITDGMQIRTQRNPL